MQTSAVMHAQRPWRIVSLLCCAVKSWLAALSVNALRRQPGLPLISDIVSLANTYCSPILEGNISCNLPSNACNSAAAALHEILTWHTTHKSDLCACPQHWLGFLLTVLLPVAGSANCISSSERES